MTEIPFYENPDPLPDTLPVFPLGGALLLPHGHLPLNIFEPRYLNMIEDALGHGRVIGMVQPLSDALTGNNVPLGDEIDIYPVGCAGRIVNFEETVDGGMMIALRGLSRFRIIRELDMGRGYRRVLADYGPYPNDSTEDKADIGDRSLLLKTVRAYFGLKDIDVDWDAVADADDEALVTSLSMICPFEPREKQALLVAPGVNERGQLLTSLMEMALHGEASQLGHFRH
ncbi:MAG: LON peptidase substrate-binding domain-containing protein [Alphaproteobacteria bacterium]